MAETNSNTDTQTETMESRTPGTAKNKDFQTSEISSVKQNFSGQCRVLADIGDYLHVVTLQPNQLDLVIKFQLTENYPTCQPQILVKSASMTEDERVSLQNYLAETSARIAGTGVILSVTNEAVEWIKEEGINLTGAKPKNKTTDQYEGKFKKDRQKRKKRKEKIEEEEVLNEKLPSMKTADDVVKRILWDHSLPRDEFLVGYIDRFLGIQEKYFTVFSWEDLASVDNTVLAIPKHRIQYFKYKDIVIWDKNKRLDNVFGSLGSKMTIYDVMEKYKKEQEDKELERNHEEEAIEQRSDPADDTDDDSDSDDGITVTTGATCGQVLQEDRILSDDDDLDEDDDFDKYWRNKMRPNHFIALRIDSIDIQKTAEHIQNIILEQEPQYESCCIPPKSLHITLCTVGLDTPEQVAHAVKVLDKIKPELANIVPKDKVLTLKGVDQFFNRVLYAKVQCPPEFQSLVEHLKLCLKEEGIEVRDNHDFVPHMTVMKITRTVARDTGKKYISPWLYSDKGEVDFGTQVVDNVYLCEMGFSRRDDGFYITPNEIHW